MKKDYCEIVMVLDESGSMNSCKNDTIGGVNEFLNNQKRVKGDVNITLIKFSDYYLVINDAVPLDQVVWLNNENYTPSNTTALLDAAGKTINSTGLRLSATSEENRPEKVIFIIITDGFENASTEFTKRQVFDLVSHQREKYNWEFIFLGADMDAWGDQIGVQKNVRIAKNDLSRSYKALSMFAIESRMYNFFDADDVFNLSEKELDQKLNDLDKK